MDIKTEMFTFLESIRAELADMEGSLTLEEKTRRGSLQEWSAKDMLAHLAFWNRHVNRQLEQGFAGKPIPKSGDYLDQVNDGVLYEHLDQPFDEALTEERDAYERFRQIVAEVSPEDLQDAQKFEFLEGRSLLDRALGTYGYHTAAHISDYYIKHGQVERARALQESITKSLLGFPGWEANAVYNLGCFYALNGYKQEAIAKVKEAFEIKPDLVDWAKLDSDLDALRDMPEYKQMVGD